jgi:hypothetical protein
LTVATFCKSPPEVGTTVRQIYPFLLTTELVLRNLAIPLIREEISVHIRLFYRISFPHLNDKNLKQSRQTVSKTSHHELAFFLTVVSEFFVCQ